MKSTTQPQEFYLEVIQALEKKHAPFMVGGTYAFNAYIGTKRESKDFDIFIPKKDVAKLLKQLGTNGFSTELLDPLWLGKVYHDKYFVDLIFGERHGLYEVDVDWIQHAKKGKVLGKELPLMPIEQIIRSKCYVHFRKKYDGGDINLLLFRFGKMLDWQWLFETTEPHWQLLFEHLINYMFVFPDAIDNVPEWILQEYIERTTRLLSQKKLQKPQRIRGQLVSYEYDIAIKKWRCKPITR